MDGNYFMIEMKYSITICYAMIDSETQDNYISSWLVNEL